MSRARATALALVNWKGVFYERYLLDRHVTALEGANGAGKTTVMIAAYVVLLPDMTRLRFTNLGESGAVGGDRGIYGRLGEPGRPSYAALEIACGEQRVIAGVHLERKAEPSVELTPFLISGLELDGQLGRVLLMSDERHESVPLLPELSERVRALGGSCEIFDSAKDYFAALFERGIAPLRLATEEDRNKLNEMLRTSMTGGISRALTSELRAFLLKEESGLADTLARMRQNLEACQRSRREVSEARHLEHEISGIYDAGQAMFAAAYFATKRRADELNQRIESLRQQSDEPRARARELELMLARAEAQAQSSKQRLEAASEAHAAGLARLGRLERGLALGERLDALASELVRATSEADERRRALDLALAERDARRAEREQARGAYEQAARGLGDFQSGLAELHRAAHAHRAARAELERARQLLGRQALNEADAATALTEVRENIARLDRECARLDRDGQSLSLRREDQRRAQELLARFGDVPPTSSRHEHARAVLERGEELAARVRQAGERMRERDSLRALLRRRQTVEKAARELELPLEPHAGPASERIRVEVERLEAELVELEAGARAAEAAQSEARRAAAESSERLAALGLAAERFRLLAGPRERLELRGGAPLARRENLLEVRNRLVDERERQRLELGVLGREREELLQQAGRLASAAAAFDPELVRLCDELDAELLAVRFDDVSVSEAAALEAELGPLAEALIVEDLARATELLGGRERQRDTVWLVPSDASIARSSGAASTDGKDVVVEESVGVRVTRIPERPTLGKKARERRAGELRILAEQASARLEHAASELRGLDALLRDADLLLAHVELLESGDPERLRVNEEQARLEANERAEDARRRALALEAARRQLRGRAEALRGLAASAHWLEEADPSPRLLELEAEIEATSAARDELLETQAHRDELRGLLDVLRNPPPDEAELEAQGAARALLSSERDAAFAAASALEHVVRERAAFAHGAAEAALAERVQVVPALEAHHRASEQALKTSEQAVTEAETLWEASVLAWQRAEGARSAVAAEVERVHGELARDAIVGASPEDRAACLLELEELANERRRIELSERELATECALLRERFEQSRREIRDAEALVGQAEKQALPASEEVSELERAANAAGLRGSAEPSASAGAHIGRPSIELWPEARGKGQLLLDRVRACRGGEELDQVLGAVLGRASARGQDYLEAWLAARNFLRKRLPAQVADVDDPLEALERLRDNLALIEQRLGRQEWDLRGASEDVARGIDVQLRRAQAQVRRLNQHLTGVRFGGVTAIRVQLARIERMDQVLGALRRGAAQELLFQPTMPIEEALDEIFRRYGGGGRGGHRILDYREYLELSVEIQRRAKQDWEKASPTRLSTGEAIGVGAALMMVVLTEWERDANLLRPKKAMGSLRFLFLDEANRLSQDNLGVLFDLCENLDLQLLIAAPEVARAQGNTTYRLVRRTSDDGRDEVIVSGRRVVPEPDSANAVPN
jgi:chromosome partition protein MukB